MAGDKSYRSEVEKYRRQRYKIRELMEYVDDKKNKLFQNNITRSGNFN
jgi:hypothetical protein